MMTTMTRRIAFIGTRDLSVVPAPLVHLFVDAATWAARTGAVLVTGAAAGADQEAVAAALAAGGRVELVLPWRTYEETWLDTIRAAHRKRITTLIYTPTRHKAWSASVLRHHPVGQRLAQGAFCLMARNYGIVNGADLVVALPLWPVRGGTAYGIRIARVLGIQTVVLWDDTDRVWLREQITAAPQAPVAR